MAWVREVRACSAQDRRIPRDLSYHGPILTEGNESGISSWFEVDDTHTHSDLYNRYLITLFGRFDCSSEYLFVANGQARLDKRHGGYCAEQTRCLSRDMRVGPDEVVGEADFEVEHALQLVDLLLRELNLQGLDVLVKVLDFATTLYQETNWVSNCTGRAAVISQQ